MQQVAARQEIGTHAAELACGTAAKDETPSALVHVVQVLHCVEYLRDALRLVHHDGQPLSRLGKCQAPLDQKIRIAQVLCTITRA